MTTTYPHGTVIRYNKRMHSRASYTSYTSVAEIGGCADALKGDTSLYLSKSQSSQKTVATDPQGTAACHCHGNIFTGRGRNHGFAKRFLWQSCRYKRIIFAAAITVPKFASDASPPRPHQTIGSAHGNAVIEARGDQANLRVTIPAIETRRGHHRKIWNVFVEQFRRIVPILHANLEIPIRPTTPHVPGCCQQKRMVATTRDHGGTRPTHASVICKVRCRLAKKRLSHNTNAQLSVNTVSPRADGTAARNKCRVYITDLRWFSAQSN